MAAINKEASYEETCEMVKTYTDGVKEFLLNSTSKPNNGLYMGCYSSVIYNADG